MLITRFRSVMNNPLKTVPFKAVILWLRHNICVNHTCCEKIFFTFLNKNQMKFHKSWSIL